MNRTRRKILAEVSSLVMQAADILEIAKSEEEEAYSNMPESFQTGERGEKMETYIESMGEVQSNLGHIVSVLEEIIIG